MDCIRGNVSKRICGQTYVQNSLCTRPVCWRASVLYFWNLGYCLKDQRTRKGPGETVDAPDDLSLHMSHTLKHHFVAAGHWLRQDQKKKKKKKEKRSLPAYAISEDQEQRFWGSTVFPVHRFIASFASFRGQRISWSDCACAVWSGPLLSTYAPKVHSRKARVSV